MAKVRKCASKEACERMNYLYQVSNFLACKNKHLSSLSCDYLNLLVNVSKKTVQRIDVEVKRSICKQCKAPQIPGITARVRVKRKQVKWTCCNCDKVKTFKVQNSQYLPWSVSEDAVVETLDYKLSDE